MTWRDGWVAFWHRLPPFRGRLAIARIGGQWLFSTRRHPIAFATLANGYRLKLDLRWSDYDSLYYFRTYEDPLLQLIRRTLDTAGASFVDVGANVGLFSLAAADVLIRRGGRALAIEPLPANMAFLRESIEVNHLGETIAPVQAAVGDAAGTLDLWSMSTGAIANAVPLGWRTGEHQQPTAADRITVPMVTLDSLVRDHGITNVRFVKIDVEGAEQFVLEGARELLARDRPLVYAEMHRVFSAANATGATDLAAFAASLGYDVHYLAPGGHVVTAPPDAASQSLDAILVPQRAR
jgi:FkbM family methyltransferase